MRSILKSIFFFSLAFLIGGNVYGQASFTASATEICRGNVITFTNTTNPAPDSVLWVSDGPGGNDVTVKYTGGQVFNPFQINVIVPGNYNVCLSAWRNGSKSETCQNITGWDRPVVDFSVSRANICPGECVTFTDLTVPGDAPITTWFWEFGGASPPTSTQQNPVACYTQPGPKIVTLVAKDANDCQSLISEGGQKEDFIIVNTAPDPSFTVSVESGCEVPIDVQFTNTTPNAAGMTFVWKFGDPLNGTSTAVNPTYTYQSIGSFDVTLIATDANGCTDSVTVDRAVVTGSINLNIVASDTIGCPPLTVNFNATSSVGGLTYDWTFPGGVPGSSTSRRDTVTFANPGLYTVELTVTTVDGCEVTEEIDIEVLPKPTADFTIVDGVSCGVPHTVTYVNNSTGATTYDWAFQGGSPVFVSGFDPGPINYNNPGEFNVSLIATNDAGCSDTMFMEDVIGIGQPIVGIIARPKKGCLDEPVAFDLNIQTPPGVNVTSILWDFKDGNTSSSQATQHTYTAQGSYDVEVTVTFDGGCPPVTKTVNIQRGEKPNVTGVVSKDTVCVREPLSYNCSGAGPGVTCIWWPGDGTKRPGCNTGYEYSDVGTNFQVSLVCQRFGCKDSVYIDKVVVIPPQAIYDIVPACGDPSTLTFINTSLFADRAYFKLFVNTTPPPEVINGDFTRSFPPGNHTIRVIAENDVTGCKDSVQTTFNVPPGLPPPTANPQEGCTGTRVFFSDPNTGLVRWVWNFGDGSGPDSTGRNVSHVYTEPGMYQACLTRVFAVNVDGNITTCRADICFDIEIYGVDARFEASPPGGCAPLNVNFTNTSLAPNSTITFIEWTIPGLGTTNDPSPSHVFPDNGEYLVKMVVEDDFGCRDSITKSVFVGDALAGFEADFTTICEGGTVTFTDTSKGFNLSCYWDFGNPGNPFNNSTDCNPSFIFNQEGSYTISLTVTDTIALKNGVDCSSTVTKPLYIKVVPFNVDFEGSPRFSSCPPLITDFELIVPEGYDSVGFSSILWEFGNGRQGVDTMEITTIYTNIGPPGINGPFYDVSVTVVANNGCTAEAEKIDYIFVDGPGGDFTYEPDSGCAPEIVTFTHQTFGTTEYNWSFGNGSATLGPEANNIPVLFNLPGVFTPSLILSDGLGCVVTIEKDDPIRISRVRAHAIGDSSLLCDGGTVNFDDTSKFVIITEDPEDRIVRKEWSLNGQIISNSSPFSYTFDETNEGRNDVILTLLTEFGCVRRDTFVVNVYLTPEPELDDDKIICRGEQIQLNISGVDTVLWGPPEVVQPVNSYQPIANPINDTTITVIYYDVPQCPDTGSLRIDVITDLLADAYPDTAICIGDTVQIFATALSTSLNETEFVWEPPFNISDVNSKDPLVWPTTDIQYIVNVTNSTCNPDRVPVNIVVGQLPEVDAGPDQFIFSGQTVELNAFSPQNVIYSWSNANTGQELCQDCQSVSVSPVTRTDYVVLADENGCRVRDTLTIIVLDECEGAETAIANSFTPNGDGINDVIGVELGPGIKGVIFFRVFNRWGEVVFETDVTGETWDGTHNGTPVNPGVYTYFLEFLCVDGNTSFRKGNITLLK